MLQFMDKVSLGYSTQLGLVKDLVGLNMALDWCNIAKTLIRDYMAQITPGPLQSSTSAILAGPGRAHIFPSGFHLADT